MCRHKLSSVPGHIHPFMASATRSYRRVVIDSMWECSDAYGILLLGEREEERELEVIHYS